MAITNKKSSATLHNNSRLRSQEALHWIEYQNPSNHILQVFHQPYFTSSINFYFRKDSLKSFESRILKPPYSNSFPQTFIRMEIYRFGNTIFFTVIREGDVGDHFSNATSERSESDQYLKKVIKKSFRKSNKLFEWRIIYINPQIIF